MQPFLASEDGSAFAVSTERLRRGALVAAAGLMGFGLILYIAANWDDLTRFQRFALAASAVAAGGFMALTREALRVPGLLLATVAAGGLLALIGQTYQTGADTWQLFALWAGLTLPWAFAARHDAVWTPWVLIAATAIALWYHANGMAGLMGVGAGQGLPAPASIAASIAGVPMVVLAAWAMSIALSAAMGPVEALDRMLGSRTWAFRLALSLTMVLVTIHAVTFILISPGVRVEVYFAGLLLLVGIATWLALSPRRDVLLIAATALAIDVTLIVGLTRLMWPASRGGDFGMFLVLGVFAAAIIGASVVAIMRLLRGEAHSVGAGASGGVPASSTPSGESTKATDASRPWPVVVLSGIGAFLAAMPFIAATSVLLGQALAKGPAIYVVAAILVAGMSMWLRKAAGLFAEQLAMVGLATGLLLLGLGLFRDLPIGIAGFVSGVVGLGTALALGRAWTGALLGAASTVGFAVAAQSLLPGRYLTPGSPSYAMVWSVLATVGIAAAVALRQHRGRFHLSGAVEIAEETLYATLSGWLGATLAGLALGSGTSFLIGAHLGGAPGMGFGMMPGQLLATAKSLSLMLAVAASLWVYREAEAFRSHIALAVMAAVAALSWSMPALGAVALLLALAILTQRRVVGFAAAVAALWIVGAFYYSLAMPLTQKAAVLAGVGFSLGIVALALGARIEDAVALSAGGRAQARGIALPVALTLIGLAAVGGVAFQAVRSKEALIRDGRPVFVELVPVDPRSLMQGDYMALRFRLPSSDPKLAPQAIARPIGIGKLDARGVLVISRIAEADAALSADETKIALKPGRGQWVVVTDAWYFKEGTASKWTAARYGELRVLPDGSALLVGLADKDVKPIK